MKPKIGLQLWSVKEECEKDFFKTLAKVKEQGYDGVEFAGYFDKSATRIKDELDCLGLEVVASHIPHERLLDNLDEVIAFEKELGNQRIVIPYATFDSLEKWLEFIQKINLIAKQVQKENLTIYYHNHAHEFSEIPDVNILEKWFENAPEVKLEIDLYWMAFANQNIEEWLLSHSKPIGLFHIKDMLDEPKESTEVNAGILPIKKFVEIGKLIDLPWLIVEQEAFQKYQPIEATAVNCKELKEIVDLVYK